MNASANSAATTRSRTPTTNEKGVVQGKVTFKSDGGEETFETVVTKNMESAGD